jgi:hypothetical protein
MKTPRLHQKETSNLCKIRKSSERKVKFDPPSIARIAADSNIPRFQRCSCIFIYGLYRPKIQWAHAVVPRYRNRYIKRRLYGCTEIYIGLPRERLSRRWYVC